MFLYFTHFHIKALPYYTKEKPLNQNKEFANNFTNSNKKTCMYCELFVRFEVGFGKSSYNNTLKLVIEIENKFEFV